MLAQLPVTIAANCYLVRIEYNGIASISATASCGFLTRTNTASSTFPSRFPDGLRSLNARLPGPHRSLEKLSGSAPEYWLNLQPSHDLTAREDLASALERITPLVG